MYREENKEEYFREYYQKNKAKLDNYRRKWAQENPKKEHDMKSRWLKSNLLWHYKWEKKRNQRNPLIRKAHRAVTYAVKTGKITKKPCKECGTQVVNAHHEDYRKPLDVIWLCPLHHRKIHKKSNQYVAD